MTTTTSTKARLPLLAALAVAAALTACGKHNDDERTAGQRLDGAIAGAKESAQETKQLSLIHI